MRRLTYENARGETITFYLSPLLIESLTGIGEVGANVQSQKSPYQDGDSYLGTDLEPRYIDLEGSITKTNLKEIKSYRSLILRVCNPKLGLGKITLELDGDIKEIEGTLDAVPAFPERGRNPFQKFLITWKCPDPYWKDIEEKRELLEAWVGGFRFPFRFPVRFERKGDSKTLMNEGDDSTPVLIEFRGPALYPVVRNLTTGEFIKLNRELGEGDTLIVNTAFGEKRVEIINDDGTTTNVFNWVDLNSTFFSLIPGPNEIEYTAQTGRDTAVVVMKYKNRYVGI